MATRSRWRDLASSLLSLVCVTLGVALALALAAAPPLREALIAAEPTFAPGLFAIALAGAASHWLAFGRAARARRRRVEHVLGALAARWALGPTILLFLAPIWSHWAGRPPDHLVAFSAALGHIPWGDARGHAEGGLRLLGEGAFGAYSERRPLHACWLAVRLAMGPGDLDSALLVQAVALAVAAFLLARAVGLKHGFWSGLATLALLQGFSRGAVPCVVTEPLGVMLASLAGVAFLGAGVRGRLPLMAAALFMLDAALNARPGPQFVAPAVALWGIWVHRLRWRRAAATLAAVLLASALLTRTLNGVYGSGQESFTTYPAHTLYGLTHGSNYRQAKVDFPDQSAFKDRKDFARYLYAKSFERLRERPQDFLATLAANEWKFLAKLPNNLSWLVSARFFVAGGVEAGDPSVIDTDIDMKTGLPAIALGFLSSLLLLARRARRDEWSFWAAVAAGALTSIPFVYGDAGFRGLAVLYPFMALLITMGLTNARRPAIGPWAEAGARHTRLALAIGLGVVAISALGPSVSRSRWPRPPRELLEALKAGETMVVLPRSAAFVVVTRVPRSDLGDVPQVTREQAARLLRLGHIRDAERLASLEAPYVLGSAYDFVSTAQQYLVGPVEMIRARSRFLRLDVRPLEGTESVLEVTRFTRLAARPSPVATEIR